MTSRGETPEEKIQIQENNNTVFGLTVKGLPPEEKVIYYLYRKNNLGKEAQVCVLVPPYETDTNQVQVKYGGGTFIVRA